MKYFQTLPTINQPDFSGNYITVTNLLSRGYLLPSLQDNIHLFYQYNIKDSDKPETIAYKYYNNQYRYWQILYANGMFDVNADWPMDSKQLSIVIFDKYKSDAANTLNIPIANITQSQVTTYATSTVHHYEQSITTFNSEASQKQTVTIQIDEDTYNSITPSSTSISFPNNGPTVTKIIDTTAVSIYDYEDKLNESKRKINLIKDLYANDMDSQLSSIMK